MARGPNPDGTIDVRATLQLKVNPQTWAEEMMGDPDALVTDIRNDVKRWCRDYLRGAAKIDEIPVAEVNAPGIYDLPLED